MSKMMKYLIIILVVIVLLVVVMGNTLGLGFGLY
jgi:hypothetical protein